MGDPDWTDRNVHDPGSPLLQLFAFLQEQLLFRAGSDPERRRRLIVFGVAAAVGLLWWWTRGDD
jgi:hypothetical protein